MTQRLNRQLCQLRFRRNDFSAAREADFRAAAAIAARIALSIIEEERPGLLLNVNFPPGSSWTLRQTCLGIGDVHRLCHDGSPQIVSMVKMILTEMVRVVNAEIAIECTCQ